MAYAITLPDALLLCSVVGALLYFVRTRVVSLPFNNIPGPPAQSFWSGHMEQYFDRHGHKFRESIAQDYGPVVKLDGFLGSQRLYIFDPKAMHNILIKYGDVFEETDSFLRINTHFFGPGLLSTAGDQHRRQRKMLNPVFSANHMRHMLPIFYRVAYKLRTAIASKLQGGPQEVDMMSWVGRAALELIGQGGLGHSFDPLVSDVKDPFGAAMKYLFPSLQDVIIWQQLIPYVDFIGSPRFRRWVLEMLPSRAVRQMISSVDIMTGRAIDIFETKKAALEKGDGDISQHAGEGKDIISILMRANREVAEADRLPEDEVIAQLVTLVFAATDTTSSTLTLILQLLAEHPGVQDKLREELVKAFQAGELSYDELMHLPYLDAVVRETLRLHPPLATITRVNREDVVLPLSQPIQGVNGQMMNEIVVPKGTTTFVGVLGANTNKAKWGEDALEWKPERWLSPLPTAVTEAPTPGVFANLMTFIGGRRSCIGFKFSEMEMKVVLSVLLPTFTFGPTEKPIIWNFAPVAFPSIGRDSLKSEMPLSVGLI
uniref:Cytochrome P450 n=1 Tax=Rhodonia placenta TaxID=104341 RepID=F1SYJ2_9APHY|nr:cytochrome P450 [Postia placenta]